MPAASTPIEGFRRDIAKEVHRLRKARRMTQADLAARLGLSQSRLSEIENGDGSFTAEQFLVLLLTFNVGITDFVKTHHSAAEELQNVLARLGARHLMERDDVLPSERLEQVRSAVREALLLGDARLLTAVAPVVVNQADSIGLPKLRMDAHEAGVSARLGWLLDNILHAVRAELQHPLIKPWSAIYRRAELLLSQALAAFPPPPKKGIDVVDRGIRTQRSLDDALAEAPPIARRWRVVSSLTPEDFQDALRGARGVG